MGLGAVETHSAGGGDMTFQGALFSSDRGTWCTPPALFEQLDAEFGFELDAAAVEATAKVPNYLGPDHPDPDRRDCRLRDWPGAGPVYANPPYGRGVGDFVAACHREGQRRIVVLLILARTDTAWWHDFVMNAAEIRFVRGRVSFVDPETGEGRHPCPAPSVVVVWRPGWDGAPVVSAMEQP